MTYAVARAKLVEIIKGATTTLNVADLPKRFLEAEEASDENPPTARRFTLIAISDDVFRPLSTTRRRLAGMQLSVWYPLLSRRADLDLVLRADHASIGNQLLRPELYGTDLISIEGPVGQTMLHADVEFVGQRVVHRYRFDMEYVS